MQQFIYFAMLLVVSVFSTSVSAHNLMVGQPPKEIRKVVDGEVLLTSEKIIYRPWDSFDLSGKVRIVQHFAARSSAKALNDQLINAITAAHFPQDRYQTTTIVNLDDAIWGTTGFARSKTENGKRTAPHSQVIIDNDGRIKAAWGLQVKTAMTMVLDRKGRIRFVKEGKLTPSEVEEIIAMVKQQITHP